MKKKIIIGSIILIAVGIVLWATVFNNGSNNGLSYKKEKIDKGDIKAIVDTTGTLNPVTIIDVGSQVSGKIKEIYVDYNSIVHKGQIIAKIDPELFLTKVKQNEANYQSGKASLEKAKVTLKNAQKKYDRTMELFNKNLISFEDKESIETQYYSAIADLQSNEARLEQAKSQMDSSRVDLEYTIIKSPIDGVVINRNINVGQTVAASFQSPILFQIANDLSKMQVECSVDEADIGKVKEGQKVRFNVDAFPNELFQGVVRQVRYSPEVIQNVVTYTTIAEVNNPGLKLRPGMTATVSIVVDEAKNVLRVPNAALRFSPELSPEEMKKIFEDMRKEMSTRRPRQTSQSGRQYTTSMGAGSASNTLPPHVWVEDEKGKLKIIFIKTGVTDNILTEIVRGNLKEEQQVITGISSQQAESSSSNWRRPKGPGIMIRK